MGRRLALIFVMHIFMNVNRVSHVPCFRKLQEAENVLARVSASCLLNFNQSLHSVALYCISIGCKCTFTCSFLVLVFQFIFFFFIEDILQSTSRLL